MAKPVLNAPHFQSEGGFRLCRGAALGRMVRLCPHCEKASGSASYASAPCPARRTRTRRSAGLYKCYAVPRHFTVRIGTIFEGSHLPCTCGFR